jgi:uncharacterized protein YkwD
MFKAGNILLTGIFIFILSQSNCQDIYDSLTLENFRNYSPFHDTIELDNFDRDLLEAAVFFLTNEIRVNKKLKYLPYNSLLAQTARIHSDQMAKHNFFDHTNKKNKKYRDPEDRAKAAGIKNPSLAENIIEGFIVEYNSGDKVVAGEPGEFINQKTRKKLPNRTYYSLADTLLDLWMNSKGHRANILSEDALEFGCGISFYKMKTFNNMPAVKATQIFQWYEPVKSK